MRKAMPLAKLWIAPFLSIASTAQAANLNDLLKKTISNLPFSQKIENAFYEIENAEAARYPQASGYANQSYGRSTLPQLDWSSELGLRLTEKLYDGGSTANRIEVAKIGYDEEKLKQQMERDEVGLKVVLKYLNIAFLLEKRVLLATQKELYERQFKFSDAQFKQGLKNRKDYLKSKSQMQRAVAVLKSNDSELLQLKEELVGIVGDRSLVAATVFQFKTVESLIEKKPDGPTVPLKQQLMQASLKKATTQLEYEKQKRTWPTLELGLEGGYKIFNYLPEPRDKSDGFDVRVSLGVNYVFWDWNVSKREILQKSNDVFIQKVNLETDLNAFRAEIDSLKIQMAELLQNQKLASEIVELEKGNFSLLESEFKQGRSSYFEMNLGLVDLFSAEQELLDTKYRRFNLAATYLARLGELYHALVR